MDLNHLLYRHQISLMRASAAACAEARIAHRGLATLYAQQIDRQRSHASGAMQLRPCAPALAA